MKGRMTQNAILNRLCRDAKLIDAHTHVGIDPVHYVRGDFPYGITGEDMALRLLSPYQGFTDEHYQACKRMLEDKYADWIVD